MSKAVVCSQAFCGIDVSAATLAVALERGEGARLEQCAFANSAAGYRRLIGWLRQRGNSVRVSLALETVEGIEVAVLNPKTVHRFAQTLRRSKTDQADARALAEYSLRMPFLPWRRPRHVAALVKDHTRLSNRLHAAQSSAMVPRCVRQDLDRYPWPGFTSASQGCATTLGR